jgi:N-methylhydantoinase B
MMGALAQAVPDKALAASSHFFNPIFSGDCDPRSGKPFIYYEIIAGGMGARADKDGVEGLMSPMNASNIPVEVAEQKSPVIIERLELIRDSGGPGRFRGACGLRKDMRLLADNVRLDNCGDRVKTAPFGLNGGRAGRSGRTVLNPGTDSERLLESKGTYHLKAGALVRIETAGGGGQGDPRCRDQLSVERDLRDGYVSVAAALHDYGVELKGVLAENHFLATPASREPSKNLTS